MPARDIYHSMVRAALLSDGWTVTHDPYRIEYGGKDVYVDIGAERTTFDITLGAERGAARIAVEVKTFTGPSVLVDLQQAVGQYMLYRSWIQRTEPSRSLYLAVDTETAESVFDAPFGQIVADDVQIQLIVVDLRVGGLSHGDTFPLQTDGNPDPHGSGRGERARRHRCVAALRRRPR